MVYRIAVHFKESHVTFFENIQSRRCFAETPSVVPRIAAVWEEAISEFKGTGGYMCCFLYAFVYYINKGMVWDVAF